MVNTTKFLGYDKDENGSLVINEKQALIIKRIYNDYLSGKSAVEKVDERVKKTMEIFFRFPYTANIQIK